MIPPDLLPEQVAEFLRGEASVLRANFDERGAALKERDAQIIEAALRNAALQPLTLTQAADETGFHPDTLGRKIRRGEIANVGRENAPRIRRGDLPRKGGRRNGFAKLGVSEANFGTFMRDASATKSRRNP